MSNQASIGTRLSRNQAAELIGVSPQTLTNWANQNTGPPCDHPTSTYALSDLGRWIREEMIFMRGRGGGGYPYMPERQRLMDALGAYPVLPGLEEEVRVTTKEEEDTRLARLKADKQELDNMERAGQLVRVDEVNRAWADILVKVKVRLLRIPSTMAPLVFAKKDVHQVQELLESGVSEALEELVDDWKDDTDVEQ